MRHLIRTVMAAIVLWAGAAVGEGLNLDDEGMILKGFDPVAYLTEGEAVEGMARHELSHDGAVVRFSSPENQALFEANPEQYWPAFGGHCAFGVRMGQKLDIDPTAFRVLQGRLLLFLDHGTRFVWMLSEDENLEIADNVWSQIRTEPAAPN